MAGAGSSAGPKEATTSASRETWVGSSPSSSASGAGGGSGGAAGAGGAGGPRPGPRRGAPGGGGPGPPGGAGRAFRRGRRGRPPPARAGGPRPGRGGGALGGGGAGALGGGGGAARRAAAAGDRADDLLDGAGALAQRQLEQDEGESGEHVHARNLPLRLAQQPLDRNAVPPFAVQAAVAALEADLAEARGARERAARRVGGEHAADQLVAAPPPRPPAERGAQLAPPAPAPPRPGGRRRG